MDIKSLVKAQDVDGGELWSITGGSDAWVQEQEQERALVKTVPSHCPVTGGHQRRPSTQGVISYAILTSMYTSIFVVFGKGTFSLKKTLILTLTILHFKNLFFVKTLYYKLAVKL